MITILHIDDDERELRLASKYLNQLSDYLRIVQTTSGNEAIEIVRKMRLDCIVADYHMPEMNGTELYSELKKMDVKIPFILLTGKGNEKVAAEAIKFGIDAYLIKEGDIYFYEELLSTIKNLKELYDREVEREKALSILRESEKYLAEVQKDARIGYVVFNISTGYWSCSTVVDEILGIDSSFQKNLEGFLDLVEPEHRNKFLYHFQNEAMGESGKLDIEFPIHRKNTGEIRWTHVQGKVSFDANGNPISMIGTIRDISDQRTLQHRLELQKLRFDSLVQLTTNGVFFSDHRGKYTEVNDQACKLTGYSREELLNLYVKDIVADESEEEGIDHFQRLLQTGESTGKLMIMTRNGEKRSWLVEARRISETSYIGVVTDLTGSTEN